MNEKYFLQRTEPLDNEAFVEEVYRVYLKRDSDAYGKSFFLHKLQNGELTRPEILSSFLQSREFNFISEWQKSILGLPSLEIMSYHIPKTAGTTFFIALTQVYGLDKIAGFLDESLAVSKGVDPQTIKVIHGHVPSRKYFSPAQVKEIIWLRDPIRRLISLYLFWKSLPRTEDESLHNYVQEKNLDLVEFAKIPQLRNEMSQYVGGRNLTDFYFVGIQGFFKDDLTELGEMLNWPEISITYENTNKHNGYNSVVKSIMYDSHIMNELIHLNREDLELYQTALYLRAKRKGISNSLAQFPLSPQQGQFQLQQV
ncbi:DUF4214 domain-containing protein [Microcoleus vaginatus]|uniref:DUF4214 domain-containing protein n=1 Tax=Microcoleus vaginatus TaxID=119532 RepID=UPI001F60BF10|nr:DUF4214 domain-containing protein [Microcoleus vaginatus HSN003]